MCREEDKEGGMEEDTRRERGKRGRRRAGGGLGETKRSKDVQIATNQEGKDAEEEGGCVWDEGK